MEAYVAGDHNLGTRLHIPFQSGLVFRRQGVLEGMELELEVCWNLASDCYGITCT